MQDLETQRRFYIGIDTSNYTTSCALFDAAEAKFYSNVKRLLGVAEGERGLRQSDAVFAHIKNLPSVTEEALRGLDPAELCAIGVSTSPRDIEGSYMPCFLSGEAAASTLANAVKKPLHKFSHQTGHVMAALWSSGSPDLLEREFIAFHVSGGTTELLRVKPQNAAGSSDGFRLDITKLGGTLDLNAGQSIDRSGVKMGLGFPCGPKLEELALANTERIERSGVSVKGCECNLSGVENKVEKLLNEGKSREYIAAYLLDFIGRTLIKLAENALGECGTMPILFAGGVMSNSIIKSMIAKRGFDARFALPVFSSDNAAGIALLTAAAEEGFGFWTK
ncbi:MAG: peptidase M22 [Clostridiales bacterium]|nr:peptidase M22 [Clostridiales bacterium]